MPQYRLASAAGGFAAPRVAFNSQQHGVLGSLPPQPALPVRKGILDRPHQQDDLLELRRQQAAFHKVTDDLDRENSWMAIGTLAPVAAVAGLEAGAALMARFAAPLIERAPLVLTKRDPYLRVGDNWATRAGRRADQALKKKLAQKPGWEYEPKIPTKNGRPLKPDVGAPVRKPALPERRFQMEYKPNTASGRVRGARQAKKYYDETGNRTRVIYYDPRLYI